MKLFVRHNERHQQSQHIAIRARSHEDHAVLISKAGNLARQFAAWSFCAAIAYQLDGLHPANTADVADAVKTLLPRMGAL